MSIPADIHSLVDLLERAFQRLSGVRRVRDRTETGWCEWTYNEYAEIVWRLRATARTRVSTVDLLFCWPTPAGGAPPFCNVACGATACRLDIHLCASELACIVAHAGLTALVTTPAFTDTIRQLRIACHSLPPLLSSTPEEPDAR